MNETWKLQAWNGKAWTTVAWHRDFGPVGRDAMRLGRAGFACRLVAPSGTVTVTWAGLEGVRWHGDGAAWHLIDTPGFEHARGAA